MTAGDPPARFARARSPLAIAAAIAAATLVVLVAGSDTAVGAWPTFNTTWFTLVLIFNLLTFMLLVEQYRSGVGPRTLMLSWGYLVASMLILCSALATPGVVSVDGIWGGDMNLIWWLWVARHAAFGILVGLALAPWPGAVTTWLTRPEERAFRVFVTGIALLVPVAVLVLLGVEYPDVLPAIHQSTPEISRLHPAGITLLLICGAATLALALYGVALRRHRLTRLEDWAIVALVAGAGEVVLVVSNDVPNSVAFYGGRAVALAGSVVVLFFMLHQVTVAHRQTSRDADRLEVQNTDLIEAQALRDHLIAVVSHEMRTPLAGLQGYLELLRDGDVDPALAYRMYDRSWMLTRRLTLLTEDLLAAATLEHGDLVIVAEPVSLSQQLAECAACFPDLDLIISCPQGLTFRADPLRLQQVLVNLVRNAQKHGAEPVRINAERDRETVVIRVTDAGPGVPAQFVPHLFDRYTQGPATATATGGSGLGLSVVKDLTEAHSGTVRYDVPTRSFVVTLPAVLSQLNPEQYDARAPAAAMSGALQGSTSTSRSGSG